MRRTVNLNRRQLIELLDPVSDPMHAACQAALTAGATFRVHDGTVTRESVLRTYAVRAATQNIDDGLRRLAKSSYAHLRMGAVSGDQRFVFFLDPDAQQIIACLGMGPRT